MNMFKYIDDEQVAQSSKGGSSSFGLQSGFFEKLQFNKGVDGKSDNVEINVNINGKLYKNWYNAIGDRIYGIASGEPDFEKLKSQEYNNRMAVIIQAIKATGVKSEDLKNVLESGEVTSFEEWSKRVLSLVDQDTLRDKKIHTFLSYQETVPEGYNVRFLEISFNFKKTKGGKIYTPFLDGEWVEVRDGDGLSYKSGDIVHPIMRNASWMTTIMSYPENSSKTENSGSDIPTSNKSSW